MLEPHGEWHGAAFRPRRLPGVYLQTAASMTARPSSVIAGFAVTTHEVAPLEAGRTSVSEVAAYWHWSQ